MLKTSFCKGVHYRRPGERFGEKDHLWMVLVHFSNQSLPEIHRLGVGIIDSEDLHTQPNPLIQNSEGFFIDALRVVIEVDWVNVLVFFRRIFSVGN